MAGDFFSGFAGGLAGGFDVGSRIRMGHVNSQMAQQKLQLQQQQQAGEVLGKFAEVLQNAPDEQVPILTKSMINWYAGLRGITPNKEVMALLNSDPRGMTAMLLNAQGQGGLASLGQLDKMFQDPQLLIGMTDAYNRRNRAMEAERATSEGLGADSTTPPSPDNTNLTTPMPQGGAALGNLQGLQNTINAINQRLATPGISKQQADALMGRRDQLQKLLELSLSNPQLVQAGQMGVDYATATPAQRSRVQAGLTANEGAVAQSRAEGQAMGGLIDPKTAADAGINPLSTVGEARGAGAGARLPSSAELGDLTQVREQAGLRMKEYRTAAQGAEAMDTTLDQLQTLLADPNLKTGATKGWALRVNKLLKDVTGIDFKDVPPAQMFEQAADSLSFAFLQKIGGNDSNTDREFARTMVASLKNDPQSNKAMIEFHKIANQRIKDREVLLGKYNKTCGLDGRKCDFDFPAFYEKWMEQHPLQPQYENVLKKYKIGPAYAPQPNPQPAAPTQVGTPLVPEPRTLPNASRGMAETGGGAAVMGPAGIRPRF